MWASQRRRQGRRLNLDIEPPRVAVPRKNDGTCSTSAPVRRKPAHHKSLSRQPGPKSASFKSLAEGILLMYVRWWSVCVGVDDEPMVGLIESLDGPPAERPNQGVAALPPSTSQVLAPHPRPLAHHLVSLSSHQ